MIEVRLDKERNNLFSSYKKRVLKDHRMMRGKKKKDKTSVERLITDEANEDVEKQRGEEKESKKKEKAV